MCLNSPFRIVESFRRVLENSVSSLLEYIAYPNTLPQSRAIPQHSFDTVSLVSHNRFGTPLRNIDEDEYSCRSPHWHNTPSFSRSEPLDRRRDRDKSSYRRNSPLHNLLCLWSTHIGYC